MKISATRTVKTNAAVADGPAMKRVANATYSGYNATAIMVAQMIAGRKLAAVHSPSATSARAKTTLAFIRALGPRGSGFCSTRRAVTPRDFAGCCVFDEAFVEPLMRSADRSGRDP
jgi:expansin (peptidoglycan-binding protein)